MSSHSYQFDGRLTVGSYKSIPVQTQLQVDIRADDDFAPPAVNDKPEDYIDGVRITGELSFDIFPLSPWDKHPVKEKTIGELALLDQGDLSKFNILLVQKTGYVDILKNQVRRYFWLFFAVGKPTQDQLEIFPKDYTGVNVNKVFYSTDFRGIWPSEVSSLIVARDKFEAKTLLNKKLEENGIVLDGDYTLQQLNLNTPQVILLNKG